MSTYWHRKDHPSRMRDEPKPPLTDTDPMPFGRYKGRKMQDVPGTYLGWLGEQDWIANWPLVKAYIIKSKKAIDWEIDRAAKRSLEPRLGRKE